MSRGMCARCRKGNRCKFREPGTWVVECDEFEEDDRLFRRPITPDLASPNEAASTHDWRPEVDE